jgi:threonine aldolase
MDTVAGVADTVLDELQRHDVRAAKAGADRIRFVLHRDLDEEMVQRCLEIVRGVRIP